MTMYSASSLAAISVSPEGHGGCGSTHHRPAPDGNPVKVWALDCPPCENFLRHDAMWSPTVSEIPETFDEVKARESLEKRSAQSSQDLTALMLAVLAGDKQAEALQRQLMSVRGAIQIPGATPGEMVCPQGHANTPGQKFCGECGSPMHSAAPGREITPPAAPGATQEAVGDLASLHPQKLRKMCREAGLDDSGKVADMAARLTEHQRRAVAA